MFHSKLTFLLVKVLLCSLLCRLWCQWVLSSIQCKPDISRSCISRNRIYRGRMLDPIFLPPISLISRTWRPRVQFFAKSQLFLGPRSRETIFREICSPRMPLIRLAGDNFPRNLLWANLAYLWNAGGNTCCAMASHGRGIIDTSIVSQSRVLLIRCPCKSMPQTANQGKTNAFLIKSSLTTCWHPPFCECWLLTATQYIALLLISRYLSLDPNNRDISGLHCSSEMWPKPDYFISKKHMPLYLQPCPELVKSIR